MRRCSSWQRRRKPAESREPKPRVASNRVVAVGDVPFDRDRFEVKLRCSKCLTQGNEQLGWRYSGNRRYVMAEIDADRAYWRVISETHADGIRPLRAQVAKTDPFESISAVVKSGEREFLLRGYRQPEFRVEDDELVAASRHLDQAACRGIGRIAAGGNRRLRTGAVQRKSSQRAAAAGEEFLAYWHLAAEGRLQKAQPQAVRPDYTPHLPVNRGLREQLAEIEIRSKGRRIHIELEALVGARVSVERVIASIPNPDGPQRRKRGVQLIRRDQFRYQQISKCGLRERVSKV